MYIDQTHVWYFARLGNIRTIQKMWKHPRRSVTYGKFTDFSLQLYSKCFTQNPSMSVFPVF